MMHDTFSLNVRKKNIIECMKIKSFSSVAFLLAFVTKEYYNVNVGLNLCIKLYYGTSEGEEALCKLQISGSAR